VLTTPQRNDPALPPGNTTANGEQGRKNFRTLPEVMGQVQSTQWPETGPICFGIGSGVGSRWTLAEPGAIPSFHLDAVTRFFRHPDGTEKER
jgi:hypothetical protein